MKLSASCRLIFCTACLFLFLLSTSTAADDDRPSVVVPRSDADRRAETEEAALEEKRRSEHERDEARGARYSYLATLRGPGFGRVKDDIALRINGNLVHEFVLHDEKKISFVIPTSIVLNKRARDTSFLEVSVNGEIRLKNIPMSIVARTARKVNFEQFRKQNEKKPPPQEEDSQTFAKDSDNSVADEYASFQTIMQEVNALLLRRNTASSRKAILLLDEEAQKGNSLAMTTLAALHLSGDYVGVAQNFPSAIRLLEKAVGLGNADAQALLGFLYASGIARPSLRKDIGVAILLWQFAANAGSQFAKIALAFRYFTGTDVAEGCETASKLYEEVARQVLEDGNRRSRHRSGKSDEQVVEIRPPAPEEMMAISRSRLHEDLETHFSSTQEDIVQYYLHSARRGDPMAQVVIGNFYHYGGPGIPQDLPQARDLFHRAARAGRMDAHAHLGFMDLRAGRNESAVEHLRKAAEADQKMGHHGLGFAALHGIGMPKDPKLAIAHFKKAAEMDVPEAMYNLGVLYNEGRGVPRKPKEAHFYFRLAAEKGHLKARYTIGYMHYKGLAPVGKDCDKAVRQFKEVAERGLWNKILARGLRAYDKGEYGNALYRYLQAAHAGIEVAQYNAAFLYDRNLIRNEGWPAAAGYTDAGADSAQERKLAIVEALELYKMSASQGNPEGGQLSLLRMGDLMYEEGEDLELAALSYEKAAKLRNAEAMFNLGMMHALGRGLKLDAYMAKRYFDQARDTDQKAYLASTVAVFALQYSDSLKQGYETVSRLVEKAKLKEKITLLLERTGLKDKMAVFIQQLPHTRGLADGVSTDAVLLTILLAALVFIVNARQRLVLARRGEGVGEEDEEGVEAQDVQHENVAGAGL